MGKKSIAQQNGPRKVENGGRNRPPGGARFTPEELAERAAADALIDDDPAVLTPEERALSLALDREARAEAAEETPERPPKRRKNVKAGGAPAPAPEAEKRAARLEARKASDAAYYRAHRAERLEYQRNYEEAHRAEINARNRARYARKKEKQHGQ